MCKTLSVILICLGSFAFSAEESKVNTMWEDVKLFTADGANSIWDVTICRSSSRGLL